MASLKTKNQYIHIIEEIIKIASNVECPTEKAERLEQAIKDYELLIPVVGEFSAGKSTFLNSFIGRKVLSVAVTPETAVATELRYSTEEFAEVLVKKDDQIESRRISIDEISNVQSDWHCIRLYLNSDNLKKIEPIVMVDMPGFDSPRDDHNRAIASYLNRGVHYVVLTSVESGTITASMKRQIQDIQNMGRGSSFFVSKANLRSEEDVKNVCEEIKEQVEDVLDESVDVKPLYKDAGAELKKLIDSIDPEQLFSKVFKNSLFQLIDELKSSVSAKIATLKNDRDQNKNAIRNMEEALDKLLKKRDKMIAEARSNRFEDDIDTITTVAGNAINAEIDRLVDMAMNGSNGEAISQEINSIVRSAVIPTINSVTKGITEKISTNFQMELQAYQGTFSLLDNPEFATKLSSVTAPLGDMAKIAFSGMGNMAQQKALKAGYKTIAGVLGIATDIVCPLAEIVILFLPEILDFIFGSISQQNQRQKIHSQILNSIPKMKRDLRNKIEPVLQQQNEEAIKTISDQFNGRVKELMDSIKKANDDLENNADVVERMQKLESAKTKLDQLKDNV